MLTFYTIFQPENILISSTGHLKIADFGTALLMSTEDRELCFDFVGTAHYVSPGIVY